MESYRDHLKLECQRGRKVKRKMIAKAQHIRDKSEREKSLTNAQAYEPPECVELLELFGTRRASQQAQASRERKLKEQDVGAKNGETDASSARMKEASIHGFA